MEETIRLPNAGCSVTVFFCDNCNPDWDPTQAQGLFLGTADMATQAGWRTEEFGHLCPKCSTLEGAGDSQVMSPAEALALLTGKTKT